jgi:hypothetical protein
MAIKINHYSSLQEANHMMAGGIIGSKFDGPLSLVGLALTFTTPAGTKTFTQPSGITAGLMRFKDFKTQLEAAIANLVVSQVDGNVAFSHATPGTAVVMANADEPAKAQLGFKNTTSISGQFLNGPSGSAPKAVDMTVENGKAYVMVEV